MNTITLHAHAKINLTLDILGRRADGYHDLSMVMQSVSLYDVLTVSKRSNGFVLHCAHPDMPREGSLVHRAFAAFFAETGLNGGAECTLECRIPMQAGLGGGSADAAAMLIALNTLYDSPLTEEMLCRIGRTLGADVPFCVMGGTRLAEGIGEQLQPLPAPPPCGIVLIKPPVGASTVEQFARADRIPNLPHPSAARMIQALRDRSLPAVAAALGNSFEAVIGLSEVAHCRQILQTLGACGACMSGSGSTVYGIFPTWTQAQAAAAQALQLLPDCFVCACTPVSVGCAMQ